MRAQTNRRGPHTPLSAATHLTEEIRMQSSFGAATSPTLGATGDSDQTRVDGRVMTGVENATHLALGQTGTPWHTQSGSTGRGC
ncbi:hypothetical protein NDU88_001737 [Pleurodeles waltl]|uniref:Uncharacterized protein n=1 Tax=Pleurodeles waltl TaxID=8319 RepID=A0AAV7WPK9_PLEWA|nr:hypothetical protein NDU88_001737 [Pleurodeles waltl]